jgi:hypothetical protein
MQRKKRAEGKGVEMRRLIFAATAVLFLIAIPSAAVAGSSRLHVRLHPAGEGTVRGTAAWAGASEQMPISLSIKGAAPDSTVMLKVCGATLNGETGDVHDQCWAAFTDRDRHLMDIVVDGDGQAKAELYPKLGVASIFLLKAERLELYSSDPTAPIAIGELKGRDNAVAGALSAPAAQSGLVARAALGRIP